MTHTTGTTENRKARAYAELRHVASDLTIAAVHLDQLGHDEAANILRGMAEIAKVEASDLCSAADRHWQADPTRGCLLCGATPAWGVLAD